MDDYIEVTGRTLDEALAKGCELLGTVSDYVEYETIETGSSSGILSLFGNKQAKIKIRKKTIEEIPVMTSALKRAQEDEEPKERVVNPSDVNVDKITEISTTFVKDVCQSMGLNVDVEVKVNKELAEVYVDIKGKGTGILIGKRGQTLDALQYLLSLAVNKDSREYIRVRLDTEDYRRRRKETLESLARNISYKVKKTRRSVSLEPMNPYERRIIHSALQNDRYVTTKSEGEEPNRHVVVCLKR
ncbi:MAG TPA: hypothetical protein DEO82_00695 [Eubacterium sp.]|nr:hypothetical protein [Eubacterium sp.]